MAKKDKDYKSVQNELKKVKNSNNFAADKAFTIPLVYEKILSRVTIEELKTMRMVNRQWYNVVSNYLTKKDLFKIHFKQYPKNKNDPSPQFCYCPNYPQNDPGQGSLPVTVNSTSRSFEEFNLCLENAKNFPCTHFKFTLHNLLPNELTAFFKIFGHKLKTLEIAHTCTSQSKSTDGDPTDPLFFNLITRQAPNLEKLDLSRFDCDLKFGLVERDQNDLTQLKYLRLTHPYLKQSNRLFHFILERAPNLKIVENFDLSHVPLFQDDPNKIEGVKYLNILNTQQIEEFNFEQVTQFINYQPKLNHLRFSLEQEGALSLTDEIKLMELFVQILRSSQRSLTCLELTEFHYKLFDTQFEWPQLPNLQILELAIKINMDESETDVGLRIFPIRINFTDKFPNLRILKFENFNWPQFFQQHQEKPPSVFQWENLNRKKIFYGHFPSVECIKMDGDFNSIYFPKLLELCPNFNKLRLDCQGKTWLLENLLPQIFENWRHLEELEIDCCAWNSKVPHWDVILTGFDPQFCQKISIKQEPVRRPGKFRKGPWLGLLTGLKKLTINFGAYHPICHRLKKYGMSNCNENNHGRKIPIQLTHISGRNAFQLMPSLKVTLGYHKFNEFSKEVKISLQSISPFVDKLVDCGGPYDVS